MYDIKTKQVRFDLKTVGEAGEFEGFAAVYGVRDELGDVIERGAFARTLHHRKGKVPILWQHQINEVLGTGTLVDDPAGLRITGKLTLEVARAREIHALMKQFLAEGMPFGLSIGYETIKADFQGTNRHLREIRLHEVSPTVFPAQELATVGGVKMRKKKTLEGKPFGPYDDFDHCVRENQDQDDPEAFCAFLYEQVTGELPGEASLKVKGIAHGLRKAVASLKALEEDVEQDLLEQAVEQVEGSVETLVALLDVLQDAAPGDDDSDPDIASLMALLKEMQATAAAAR